MSKGTRHHQMECGLWQEWLVELRCLQQEKLVEVFTTGTAGDDEVNSNREALSENTQLGERAPSMEAR